MSSAVAPIPSRGTPARPRSGPRPRRRPGGAPAAFAAIVLAALVAPAGTGAQSPPGTFVNFESGHVRPLAASPDGSRLFAVNTPDNRLAVFAVTADGLDLVAEVPVGLEPVAVAARTDDEVWVVNHLSDSVSIVRIDPVDPARSRVVRTLHTCDEPRDLVFAGPGRTRAFVTTARRGQRCPVPAELTTEGIGRAVVQVFDATALGAPLGGTPIANLVLFADTPRALAVSEDGTRVWAAAFRSGNQTTTIHEALIPDGGEANGGLPDPPPSAFPGGPEVGLIVKYDPASDTWQDETGRDFSSRVAFDLPDLDVFAIDAMATPPVEVAQAASVGTILFGMAVRPGTQRVFVGNLSSRNEVRFEGIVPDGEHGVRGHIAENRVSIVDGASVQSVHLNPHIDYSVSPGPPEEIAASKAFPVSLAFEGSGGGLWVAAFGSRRVVRLDADALEAGLVVEEPVDVGGGPTGIVLDEARDRLYVMNRFDQRIGIVTELSDPSRRAQTATVGLRYDPSPAPVKKGRRHLYEAALASGHGDAACASCHIFADLDDLAWDLGDASDEAEPLPNPNPFRAGRTGDPFHPLKGPMTTQSLRGLADAGPMHWRGDRTGGMTGGDPLDEELAFLAFNPAFVGLMGRAEPIPDGHMQEFTDFILTVRYPPNPIRALDDVPTPAEAAGEQFFVEAPVDGGRPCVFCHRLPLGADGFSSFEGETQQFKIAHMRNLYQKVGMFGVPAFVPNGTGHLGPQVRGFGFLHDGSVPTVFRFLQGQVFDFPSDAERRNVEAFGLAFDTGLAPIVGQQVTLDAGSFADPDAVAAVDLLIERDEAGDCRVVVKGNLDGEARGAVYAGAGRFLTDRESDGLVGEAALRGLAQTPGNELTYTCVPPGSGFRIGVDRDGDGRRDRDETDAGTDPADPASFLGQPEIVTVRTSKLVLKDDNVPPIDLGKRKISFQSSTRKDPPENRIVPPEPGSPGDPMQNGARLLVYNANGSGEEVEIDLPASGWLPLGAGWRFNGGSDHPIRSLVIKEDSLRLRGGDEAWPYTLDEPVQGRMALRLTLGSAVTWCAEAPAKLSGRPPSPARNDHVDRFVADPKHPAPETCPVAPLGGSPSGAFLDGAASRFF